MKKQITSNNQKNSRKLYVRMYYSWPFRLMVFGVLIVTISIGVLILSKSRDSKAATTIAILPGSRDPIKWPFARDSIWNTPLGAGAKYIPAGFKDARGFKVDVDRLYVLKSSDPIRPIYYPTSWTNRCGPYTDQNTNLNFPDNITVPDASTGSTPNNATAFLLPDGQTLLQVSMFTRCTPGGPLFGRIKGGPNSIYGPGIPGGHGGSGLSSIGGTIRKGELTSSNPIQHVLKFEMGCQQYCSYSVGAGGGKGYRWPAKNADGYASTAYLGTNPSLMMGSLLALPPNTNIGSLNLKTEPAKKIAQALKIYGAYVVDDTAYDGYAFAMEEGVKEEVGAKYGYGLNGGLWTTDQSQITPFYWDMMAIAKQLNIIDDNSSSNIGGAGARLASLAPCFIGQNDCAPTTSPAPAPAPTPTPTPTPSPDPVPTPTPDPSTPPPPVSIPNANPSTPVFIPSNLPVQQGGTLIADFNGDGLNDVAKDTNNDNKIDPKTEIVVDGKNNKNLTDTTKAPITASQYANILYPSAPLSQSSSASADTITIKAGPLPETKVSKKTVVYSIIAYQTAGLAGVGGYFALTKLGLVALVKRRLFGI